VVVRPQAKDLSGSQLKRAELQLAKKLNRIADEAFSLYTVLKALSEISDGSGINVGKGVRLQMKRTLTSL
jgi:hypothetical protein